MAQKIGSNPGTEAIRLKLRELDVADGSAPAFGIDNVFGKPGQKYPDNTAPNTPAEGTLSKLIAGHNEHEDRIAALEVAVQQRPFFP